MVQSVREGAAASRDKLAEASSSLQQTVPGAAKEGAKAAVSLARDSWTGAAASARKALDIAGNGVSSAAAKPQSLFERLRRPQQVAEAPPAKPAVTMVSQPSAMSQPTTPLTAPPGDDQGDNVVG